MREAEGGGEGTTERAGGKHRGVCEQRVRAKRMRLLDTGLSAQSVKRKQDYVKIITYTGEQKKYLHVFQKFSRVR